MHPDPLTPYGNRPMVTPIVNAVNYEYASFEVLRQITEGEVDGYTYHRDDNPTVREVERKVATSYHEALMAMLPSWPASRGAFAGCDHHPPAARKTQ